MFIQPKWPAPLSVKAVTTLRTGGVSHSPFDSFNLAMHVEDSLDDVTKNRHILQNHLALLSEPCWLNQTHSTKCVRLENSKQNIEADASYTTQKNIICAILTADCLPILLCNKQGTLVSAIHAGWRGLAHGIIEKTIKTLPCETNELIAWLGPAIGPKHFEVGNEVKAAFLALDSATEKAFSLSVNNRFMCDIYTIARLQLIKLGIPTIYGGEYCTYSDTTNFYSYRRDGVKTGRMASLIWIA